MFNVCIPDSWEMGTLHPSAPCKMLLCVLFVSKLLLLSLLFSKVDLLGKLLPINECAVVAISTKHHFYYEESRPRKKNVCWMNRRKLGRLASTVTIHSARYHYTLNHFNHLLSVCVLVAIISLCYEILHLMRFGLMCHILVRCFYTSQSALTQHLIRLYAVIIELFAQPHNIHQSKMNLSINAVVIGLNEN